jgi:alpha-tubulin suppressor-like RCC1 family protein
MNLQQSFSSLAEFVILKGQDGEFYVWGNNRQGGLGLGKELIGTSKPTPVKLPIPLNPTTERPYDIVSLACGMQHTLAITADHKILGWGANGKTQLGACYDQTIPEPTLLSHLLQYGQPLQVACSAFGTALVTKSGDLYMWGENALSQCASPESDPISSPKKIDLPPVAYVACGYANTIALTKDGHLYGWGRNSSGELGLGIDTPIERAPVLLPINDVASLYLSCHVLATKTDGTVYSWGWNKEGSCGQSHTNNINTPTELSWLRNSEFRDLACGAAHCLALFPDGSIWGWGSNYYGQIGTKHKKGEPTKIAYIPNIAWIGCGNYYSIVISKKGNVYTAGAGKGGQLGNGTLRGNVEELKKIKNFKAVVPTWIIWDQIFKWLFLGQLDSNSEFSFPVEVIFHFVGLRLCI